MGGEALREELDSERDLDEQLATLVHSDHRFLAEAGITSLAPLAHMTNVVFLEVSRNPLTSLAGIEGHRQVHAIRASHRRIHALSHVAGFASLDELEVNCTAIDSLAPRVGCSSCASTSARRPPSLTSHRSRPSTSSRSCGTPPRTWRI